MMREIFNPLLGRNKEEELKVERVHRIRKPVNVREDSPRDVIVRFHPQILGTSCLSFFSCLLFFSFFLFLFSLFLLPA